MNKAVNYYQNKKEIDILFHRFKAVAVEQKFHKIEIKEAKCAGRNYKTSLFWNSFHQKL